MIFTGTFTRIVGVGAGLLSAGLIAVPGAPPAAAAVAAGGALDPAFGTGGKVVTDVTGAARYDVLEDIAVAPDGKIVAVGSTAVRTPEGEEEDQPDYDFVVARYNADGTLDATFGDGGVVRTGFGGTQSYDQAAAVAVQRDGRIVVAGDADPDLEGGRDYALARYRRDGSLDPTFGDGGRVVAHSDVLPSVSDLVIQPDGRIVLGGSAQRVPGSADWDFALVRLRPNGVPDTSFGDGGRALTPVTAGNASDSVEALALQPDGRVVAVGSSASKFALARYLCDGTLDGTFGTGGTVVSAATAAGASGVAFAVALQSDGRIVVAGSGGGFAVHRYRSDGTLDPAFGAGGKAGTPNQGRAEAVALQPDGGIVVGGMATAPGKPPFGWDTDFTLVRYRQDGTADTSFGSDGSVWTDFAGDGGRDEINAMAVQPGGRIVAAGETGSAGGDADFGLAGYLP